MLQGASFVLASNPPRPRWWPFLPSRVGEVALAAAAIILAYASCWLCVRAVQTLASTGPTPRVIKGHELITEGPYGVVRNPIYLGMFRVILSTCLAFSRWWSGFAAIVLFLIANHIRIHTEEQLLRETLAISSMSTRGASRLSSRNPGDDPTMVANADLLSCWKTAIVTTD